MLGKFSRFLLALMNIYITFHYVFSPDLSKVRRIPDENILPNNKLKTEVAT